MNKIIKIILKSIAVFLVCPLFACGKTASVHPDQSVPGEDYVEHEAIVILRDPYENHQFHGSDALIDQGEVLMELSGNRKTILVKDETRTASELVKFLLENDRVQSAEINRISRMLEE